MLDAYRARVYGFYLGIGLQAMVETSQKLIRRQYDIPGTYLPNSYPCVRLPHPPMERPHVHMSARHQFLYWDCRW